MRLTPVAGRSRSRPFKKHLGGVLKDGYQSPDACFLVILILIYWLPVYLFQQIIDPIKQRLILAKHDLLRHLFFEAKFRGIGFKLFNIFKLLNVGLKFFHIRS